jgi:uridine monophosphate synthetase
MSSEDRKVELALDLHEIGALKFGEFTFVSGIVSPMYIDLRLFISYPKILKKVAKLYAEQLSGLTYDRLAGVAYAALPIAGAISLELEQPWIFMRKEGLKKGYGLKKSLEGEYNKGETVVMIEDLVTKATSLLQAIPAIENQGLVVKDAVVLLDYCKGGGEKLKTKGYNLHAFMTVRESVDIMQAEGKIDANMHAQCVEFLESEA